MTPTQRSIERIRAFAKHMNWRKTRLAKEAGLHANTLRFFDDADWTPRTDTLIKLERIVPADFMPDEPEELKAAS